MYVTASDKKASGLGLARGKVAKIVIEVEDEEQAEKVSRYLRSRTDMKYVNVSHRKPWYDDEKYVVTWIDKKYANAWIK